MLDKLREMSIDLWSPVGDIFSSIFETSNVWFPIISYILIMILFLIIIKKFLDKTVSSVSSLNIQTIWAFLKKLIFYTILIGLGLAIVLSLYFYLSTLYNEHTEETVRVEQSVDYLLR